MHRIKGAFKISAGSFNQFVSELRKAAKQGMALEEYYTKGRPFKFGRKQLA